MKKKNSAVFLFGDEWGEIDTILPLIQSLKRKKKLSIIVIITKNSTYKKKNRFTDLYKILKNNSDLILYPNYFKLTYLLKNNFNLNSIKNIKLFLLLLVKLITKNDFDINPIIYEKEIKKKYNIKYFCNTAGTIIKKEWFNNKKNIKYLILPHAPTFKGGKLHNLRTSNIKKHDENRKKKFNYYKNYPINTKFFTSDNDEKSFFEKYCPKNLKLIPIGFTRLEKEWIDTIKKISKKLNKKKKILILFGKTTYIGEEELKKKFKNVLLLARKYSYGVKFKFHPKSIFNISSIISTFNDIIIEEAVCSVMAESIKSDIVISTSKSGACLDSIAVDTPVVEYYSYANGIEDNMQNEFKINGKVTSLFSYHKLVETISNFEDLSLFFNKINQSKKYLKNISTKQKKALQKVCYNKGKVYSKFLNNIQ